MNLCRPPPPPPSLKFVSGAPGSGVLCSVGISMEFLTNVQNSKVWSFKWKLLMSTFLMVVLVGNSEPVSENQNCNHSNVKSNVEYHRGQS